MSRTIPPPPPHPCTEKHPPGGLPPAGTSHLLACESESGETISGIALLDHCEAPQVGLSVRACDVVVVVPRGEGEPLAGPEVMDLRAAFLWGVRGGCARRRAPIGAIRAATGTNPGAGAGGSRVSSNERTRHDSVGFPECPSPTAPPPSCASSRRLTPRSGRGLHQTAPGADGRPGPFPTGSRRLRRSSLGQQVPQCLLRRVRGALPRRSVHPCPHLR